jgi:hypothetical protein
VAFYADRDYTEDETVLEAAAKVMRGELTLHWFNPDTEHIKTRPSDPRRGLTFTDIDIGSYGHSQVPEHVRHSQSMAARGSDKSGKMPDMGYVINRKSDVWSDNVLDLYEEAKARRWVPATDIPWAEIDKAGLSHEMQAACAQLYTFVQECALVDLDFSSKWVPLINQDFTEQKSFMCAQMLDASRLLEAFRKRALLGGAGLGRASVTAEQGLKEWLWAATYPSGSLSINLALGGYLLALYRQIAAFAPTRADRALMGFAMQDAARQTAYGVGHIRYHLHHQPAQEVALQEYLDETEHVMLGLLGSPELLEPLIVICGGGLRPEQVRVGRDAVAKFIRLAVREYLERLESAALFGRLQRSRIPAIIEQVAAAQPS